MIISGSASQSLAASVAAATDRPLAPVSFERFPDDELLTTVADVGDDAAIIAATTSSDTHIELLQLQDALREAGTATITTVLPYMGYARQDTAFEPGQPVSARAIARAISTQTDRVLVVNPHAAAVCDFFDPPAEALDAAGQLAAPLPDDLEEPLFLAPDANALSLAETVREAYGTGATDYFEKTRLSGTEVDIAPSDTAVTDRDIIVVDDIIATGGTMSEAISVLHDRGAERVFATCVHPLLAQDARARLARAGVEAIYGTDTIERAESVVSAAPVIANAL